MLVETHRRRHLAYLMADQGGLVGNPDAVPNLPKQHLNRYKHNENLVVHTHIYLSIFLIIYLFIFTMTHRRQMKRSKSMLQTILFGNDSSEDDAKSKNIRQTGTFTRNFMDFSLKFISFRLMEI